MDIKRRDFLRLLFGVGAGMALKANAATRVAGQLLSDAEQSAEAKRRNYDTQLLLDSFIETLKLNEGLRLNFYRCTSEKVTIGYGSNVQANPGLLDGVKIYHRGKTLDTAARQNLMKNLQTLSNRELAKYTIMEKDAAAMAKRFLRESIPAVCRFLSRDKTEQTFFYDLPLCMQALALDIFYNLGETKFRGYKKFRTALEKKDYDAATEESLVYTDKKEKKVNKARERRKKQLVQTMRFVQMRFGRPVREIMANLEADCLKRLRPTMNRLCYQRELRCEKLLAICEIDRIKRERQRSQALAPLHRQVAANRIQNDRDGGR